ncbi:MAG TPA: hypothetical protein PLN34_06855 [Alloprevotella sp.]|nr:hypothetical protein [Alloprevotella sp.]
MTKEEEATLHVFETRVRQLILAYDDLRKENNRLRCDIRNKEEENNRLSEEIDELRLSYVRLKTAKMMEISDDDMKNARQRLNQLMSEIDKCIALLNL